MAGKKGRSGRPPGRPRGAYKPIDLEKLRNLALIGMSIQKMARTVGVSHDTLQDRYHDVIDEARGDGETQILAKIFQLALNGNVRCLELCAINRCNWANRPEVMVNVMQNFVPSITEETKTKLTQLHELIRREALLTNGNGNGNSQL